MSADQISIIIIEKTVNNPIYSYSNQRNMMISMNIPIRRKCAKVADLANFKFNKAVREGYFEMIA